MASRITPVTPTLRDPESSLLSAGVLMVAPWRQDLQIVVVGRVEEGPPSTVSHNDRADWIVAARWCDEASEAWVIAQYRLRFPTARLAGLGPADDIERFERWQRRGALVYMTWPADQLRFLEALRLADRLDTAVYDRCFLAARHQRQAEMARLLGQSPLTRRELEVMHLLRTGRSNPDVARELSISLHTVEFHVGNILSKLRASSRLEAVERARQMGL